MPNQYVNKVVQSNGTTLIDISDTTAAASDVASGKYFYLASGEKVAGTASGGAILTTKSITANGTYHASSDNADGYSSVTVNVPLYFNSSGYMYTVNYESPATAQTAQLYECENLETIYAPNATTCGQYAGGRNCSALKSVHFPKCAVFPQYFIRQQGAVYNKLESVIVGSIGYPVTSLAQRWRYGNHAQTLTVTIYVNAETLADISTDVTRYATGDNSYAPSGSVVNVVYRNSNTGNVIAT